MKCPNCHSDMTYTSDGNAICYYKCPECGYTIGKRTEEKESEDSKDEQK